MAIATKPVAPIQDCRDDIPEELTEVLERMPAKNPDDRYATALEVAEAVSPLAEVEGNLGSLVAAARAEPDSIEPKEACRRSTFDPVASAFVDTRPTEVKIRPQPAAAAYPPWRRGTRPWLIAAALFLVFGGSFAAHEIIITIRDEKTGKEQTLKVPDHSDIIISPAIPDHGSSKRPSHLARPLITRLAKIDGMKRGRLSRLGHLANR